MVKKLTVDKDKCIGCGSCAALAPKTFVLEDGKSKATNPSGDDQNAIKSAIDSCPVDAITWEK
jgi:ferredoxin